MARDSAKATMPAKIVLHESNSHTLGPQALSGFIAGVDLVRVLSANAPYCSISVRFEIQTSYRRLISDLLVRPAGLNVRIRQRMNTLLKKSLTAPGRERRLSTTSNPCRAAPDP